MVDGLNDTWRQIFVVIEGGLINVIVMLWIQIAPVLSLAGFAGQFANNGAGIFGAGITGMISPVMDPILQHPALALMWRNWGYMIIVVGFVEVTVLTCGSTLVCAGFMLSVAVSDVLHLAVSFTWFFSQHGLLDGTTVFGFVEAAMCFVCRLTWLTLNRHKWMPHLSLNTDWLNDPCRAAVLVVHGIIFNLPYVFWIAASPSSFIKAYMPAFAHDQNLLAHPVTMLVVYSWGYMLLILAPLEVSVLMWGSVRACAGLMMSFLAGDILHLAAFLPFFMRHGVWDALSIIGIVSSIAIFALRIMWLSAHRSEALAIFQDIKNREWRTKVD